MCEPEQLPHAAAAFVDRSRQLAQLYTERLPVARELQRQLRDDVLPALAGEAEWDESEMERAEGFVDDLASIFRFLRRAKFNPSSALDLVQMHLLWRLEHSVDLVSLPSLEAQYIESDPTTTTGGGLFYFLPDDVVDRAGRRTAVLNLRSVRRTDDGSLDGLKEFILWSFEVARRHLRDVHAAGESGLAFTLLVDAERSSMTNLELELLPSLLDIANSHYPGLCASMLVISYGWALTGAWAILKRLLPATVLAKIAFVSKSDLPLTYYEPYRLPTHFGGLLEHIYDPSSNAVLRRYSRAEYSPLGHQQQSSRTLSTTPTPGGSRSTSRPLSRATSYESIADIFYHAHDTFHPHQHQQHHPQNSSNKKKLSMSQIHNSSNKTTADLTETVTIPFDRKGKGPSGGGGDRDSSDGGGRPSPRRRDRAALPRVNSLREFHLTLPTPFTALAADDQGTSPYSEDGSFLQQEGTPASASTSIPSTLSSTACGSPAPRDRQGRPAFTSRRFTSERRPSAEEMNPVAARAYALSLAGHHASGLSSTTTGTPIGELQNRLQEASGTAMAGQQNRSPSRPAVMAVLDQLEREQREQRQQQRFHQRAIMKGGVAVEEEDAEDEEELILSTDLAAAVCLSSSASSSLSPSYSATSPPPRPPSTPQPTSSSAGIIPFGHHRHPSSSGAPLPILQQRHRSLHPPRKRDYLKTLIFLFLLRLQSLKGKLGVVLGLTAGGGGRSASSSKAIAGERDRSSSSPKTEASANSKAPSSQSRALMRASHRTRSDVSVFLFTALFLALRGTWMNALLSAGATGGGVLGGGYFGELMSGGGLAGEGGGVVGVVGSVVKEWIGLGD